MKYSFCAHLDDNIRDGGDFTSVFPKYFGTHFQFLNNAFWQVCFLTDEE